MVRLDIGCGSAKKKGFLGVDVTRTEATDVVADAVNLPFKDCCIEYVYSRRCIQHIKDDLQALKEVHRVLKWGGKLELITASLLGCVYYKLGFSESSGKYPVFHLYFSRKLRRKLEKANFTHISIQKVKSTRKIGYDLRVICEKL